MQDLFLLGLALKSCYAVRLKDPLIRIELEDAVCTCIDWANSEILAVGCSNGIQSQSKIPLPLTNDLLGNVLVYDLKDALLSPQKAESNQFQPTSTLAAVLMSYFYQIYFQRTA